MKTIKTMMMAMIAIFFLWSCDTDNDQVSRETNEQECSTLQLSFVTTNGQVTTGFGEQTATAIEKLVKTASIYIFDNSTGGSFVFKYTLSQPEINQINTQDIIFKVPGLKKLSQYNCAVIINQNNLPNFPTQNDLINFSISDIPAYNGRWVEVNDAVSVPKRSDGFAMSQIKTFTTDLDAKGKIQVPVIRTSAKLDIETTVQLVGLSGTYQVDSIKVMNTQANTSLIPQPGSLISQRGTLSFVQASNHATTPTERYQNRFYIFENGAFANHGDRVNLRIYGTYTLDGVKSPIVHNSSLATCSADGSFKRDGAYAVKLNITGLGGTEMDVKIIVCDWTSFCTQVINLDNNDC
ncbi:MAG: hypothetical protein RSA98_02725 [Odoribacter sp.]